MVRLQRAAAASHQRGQLIEAIRVDAAITLAAAGIVVTLAGHGRTAVSIIGAAWFVVSAFFLRHAAASIARQGALLQEMFDTELFHLPWRSTVAGEQVPEPDIAQLARRLQAGSKKDQRILAGWYDPTDGVHHPYDVLIAQEQNLGWDARLRRRYAALVLTAAVIWSGLGLIVGMLIAGRDDRQHPPELFHPLPGHLPDRPGDMDWPAARRRRAPATQPHGNRRTPERPARTDQQLRLAPPEGSSPRHTRRNPANPARRQPST